MTKLFTNRSSGLPVEPVRRHALAFLNSHGLSGIDVRELINLTTGPLNLDAISLSLRAQAEREHQFTLRKITRSRPHHLGLFVTSRGHVGHRADAIAVRLRPHQFQA